jgi:hypothetical protein
MYLRVYFEVCRPSVEFTQPAIWYWEPFPRGIKRRRVKLTTHLPLVSGLRMSGAVTPLPHMPSWRAQGQIYPLERNRIRDRIKERI